MKDLGFFVAPGWSYTAETVSGPSSSLALSCPAVSPIDFSHTKGLRYYFQGALTQTVKGDMGNKNKNKEPTLCGLQLHSSDVQG